MIAKRKKPAKKKKRKAPKRKGVQGLKVKKPPGTEKHHND